MSPQERIEFINALEIDPEATRQALNSQRIVTTAEKASAAVVASSVISFVGEIDDQNRADVMNATLLAQLVADAKFSKTKQTSQWYDKYQESLAKVGWITKNIGFTKGQRSGTIDALVIEFMASYLTCPELELLKETVAAVKNNERALTIFDNKAKSGRRADFQVGVCRLAANGNVIFGAGYFDYSTSAEITHVLFFDRGNATFNFERGHQVMELDGAMYSDVRSIVLKKLGPRTQDSIEELDI